MINAGIKSEDLLIVDKKISLKDGSIAIVSVNNEFTVKRLSYKNVKSYLMPENPLFKPIMINESDDVKILGVVMRAIHSLR